MYALLEINRGPGVVFLGAVGDDQAVGIILTGQMDDGTAGLRAIKGLRGRGHRAGPGHGRRSGDAAQRRAERRRGPLRSPLTCPDCGGGLWEMKDTRPLRYRCRTGHAYSSLSLSRAQKDSSEHALRSMVRALREREMLLRRMAGISSAVGEAAQAAAAATEADRIRQGPNPCRSSRSPGRPA